MKLAVTTNRYMQNLTTIHGFHIATDFFRRQLLHEQEFATQAKLTAGTEQLLRQDVHLPTTQ